MFWRFSALGPVQVTWLLLVVCHLETNCALRTLFDRALDSHANPY